MKVCLIRPGKIVPMSSLYTMASSAYSQSPPIGLALIAAAIDKAGHEVDVIDCLGDGLFNFHLLSKHNIKINGISLDEMVARIPKDVDVLGVTMMFSVEWIYYEAMVNRLKEEFPNVKIIAGGEHISAEYKNVFDVNQAIDFAVIGEGEETIIDLLDALKTKRDIQSVKGIAYRKNNQTMLTLPRTRIKKIDEIAPPLWDKFPIEKYLDSKASQSSTNLRAMPILAQRGCPYLCSFCSNKDMWGTDYYLRDPELVIQEIKGYIEKYQIEHLDFCDPVGVLNRKWIITLLTRFKEENFKLSWINTAGTRSEILDDQVLTLFRETGAQRISLAPESGSKEVIKRMKKHVNLDKFMIMAKLALTKKLVLKTHIMYGLPKQTKKEVFESLIFSFKLAIMGVHDVNVHLFSAYPGTKDYKDLIAAGEIDIEKIKAEGKYAEFLLSQTYGRFSGINSWSDGLPAWILPYLQLFTYLMHFGVYYLLRPWKVFGNINNAVIKKKPISMIENLLFQIFYSKKESFEG
jgi:anaerobic magnesium-protoporphyrin IX monomethyl ester cyclase